MIKKTIAFGAFALAAAGMTASGSAQDILADPISDTVYLEAGFVPDPTVVNVISGGTIDVSTVVSECSGYISDAPDVRLTFSASNSATASPLYIHAISDEDTTLVINAPDGQWYCNDDGSEGLNPLVVFGPAQSGNYEIWIGSYEEGAYNDATLSISEIDGE